MKIFWPHRSKAKGFSFEKLSSKYFEKVTNESSKKNSNQLLGDRNLKSKIKNSNHKEISSIFIKRGHWANRDFSEYREAA